MPEFLSSRRVSQTVNGPDYSVDYFWLRASVRVRVHHELSAQQARDLAASLLYFADNADEAAS